MADRDDIPDVSEMPYVKVECPLCDNDDDPFCPCCQGDGTVYKAPDDPEDGFGEGEEE